MNDKIKKEQEFHDNRFGGNDPRKSVGKFYAVKTHANQFFNAEVGKRCNGKKLLEYGCGYGNSSAKYIDAGAQLLGIDISPEGVKRAKSAARASGLTADYQVMDAERMTFSDDTFDLCVGSGILHHLDLDKSLSEISRVLNKRGAAIFIEPMGHNPIINWYRNKTPSMRTDDEHPLLKQDLDGFKQYFNNVEESYFALSTLIAAPLVNTFAFSALYKVLQSLDRVLFKLPFLRYQAWTVVITMSEPITTKT
ncbi:MAG: SAM-dependent methyltransferase [Arenicella sp.]|jgi:SAM-dependent methyltransferase